jgi:hypothetical protein
MWQLTGLALGLSSLLLSPYLMLLKLLSMLLTACENKLKHIQAAYIATSPQVCHSAVKQVTASLQRLLFEQEQRPHDPIMHKYDTLIKDKCIQSLGAAHLAVYVQSSCTRATVAPVGW